MANVGDEFEGTVKDIKEFGVFVTVGAGKDRFDGLIHNRDLNCKLSPGEQVKVRVKEIKEVRGEKKIGFTLLSKKAGSENPKPGSLKLGDSFYADKANRELRAELFTEFAPQLAQASATARDKELTTNALRNFYDAVKAIENPILQAGSPKEKEDVFRRQLPHIKLLAAKVAHYQPEKPKIPKVFADFLYDSIKIINDLEEFEGFVLVFEAVAGWHTKYAKKGDN